MRTRHFINTSFIAITVACAALLMASAGCSGNKNQSSISGVPAAQANEMNAEHSKFETANDPPLNADTRFAAGQLAESQGAPDKAIMQYAEAVKLNPNQANALYRLGICYSSLRDYPKAIDAWQRYIKATNDSATGYANLAFCQELSGNPAAAEASYKKGVLRDPKNEPCRVNYGILLARQSRTAEAITQFSAVLSIAEVHYNLGSVYEQQGKTEQARAEYQKAIDLDPKLADARKRLAGLK